MQYAYNPIPKINQYSNLLTLHHHISGVNCTPDLRLPIALSTGQLSNQSNSNCNLLDSFLRAVYIVGVNKSD